MTESRPLVAAEHMVDVFDRASTMNFTTIVAVRGPLDDDALDAALRAVERRHPLLRARIARKGGLRFVMGEGEKIALRVLDATKEEVNGYAEATLAHRVWPDAGPRAELVHLRHALGHSTLLFTMHHVVGDGSSGVIVVRDILRALAGTLPDGVVPSPGQNAFFPEGRGGMKDLFASLRAMSRASDTKPFRLEPAQKADVSARCVHLHTITLDIVETDALLARARAASSTAHGVLVAATARAIAHEGANGHPLRVMHPVDFRRMLDGTSRTPIGDAVGYYVSSVETDLVVAKSGPLDALASEVSALVREKKREGEPYLMAPSAGKLAIAGEALLGISRFRTTAERTLPNTFAITNLAHLEALGLEETIGALTITHAYFVAASSVLCAIGASASTFGGSLRLVLATVAPLVPHETGARIAARIDAELRAFASS